MEKIEEIKKELRSGDQKLIAEITGYTTDYVKMVLNGIRKNERIVEVAQEVITNREELLKRLKGFNHNLK